MKWDRILLQTGIAVVVAVMVFLLRVLIRAMNDRSRRKGYSTPLPPPPKPAPGAGAKPATPGVASAPKGKRPVLVGVAGLYQGAIVPIEHEPIVIGRDPAASNLVFPDEHRSISARHCTIKVNEGRFFIEDCFSTNGTYLLNGRSLTPGQSIELKPGDRFTIGDRKNIFEVAFK